MTAEIAIMNKDGIALAADSAVTIDTESGKKIFNTTNKLFALSKHAPVGIMIYGGASLMGVPWESIIKIYRNRIGHRNFPSLQDYLKHFVEFLAGSPELFPKDQQETYFRRSTLSAFVKIRKSIEQVVEELLKSSGKATPPEIGKAVEQVCKAHEQALNSVQMLDHISQKEVRELKNRFGVLVIDVAQSVFGALPLSPAAQDALLNVAVERWCRNTFDGSSTGVVIAGFGQNDVFPSLLAMVIGGVAEGIVRYQIFNRITINHQNTASIKPFAQHEMVESFMEGIDPNCRSVIEAYWNKIIERYHLEIISALGSLSDPDKAALQTKLSLVGQNILREFSEHLNEYQQQAHVDPVIDAVAVLPKDLLAEVAESLVNLTSFKRRISMTSAETVGGPIDVAVISRGDGFVWIKRKHYFKPELNPQFFANMLGDSHATTEEEASSRAQKQRGTKKN